MYAIRSYYADPLAQHVEPDGLVVQVDDAVPSREGAADRARAAVLRAVPLRLRITSYNVCYTKLLRGPADRAVHRHARMDHRPA